MPLTLHLLASCLIGCIILFPAGGGTQESPAEPAESPSIYPKAPEGLPPKVALPAAEAQDAASMQAYTEVIPGTEVSFEMLPIRGGRFLMGSPEDEEDRGKDEGPVHEVEVEPFWMGKCEVTWDEYHLFMFRLDQKLRESESTEPTEQDAWADAVTRPTPPYLPMDFGMGVSGYPAVCMTQFAAKQYTKWLSMKTGRFYRLPTEAEWEYACRAGTKAAYSFGADDGAIDEYAWYFDNADDQYQKVGQKKPNAFGLHDMHGNVWEWVLDAYSTDFYGSLAGQVANNPVLWPTELYPRTVRGGSWDSDAEDLRSAARRRSRKSWKVQDPQLPKSIWYHTDATDVGFRIVRPLREPSADSRHEYFEADLESIREIEAKQRSGGR